MAEVIRKAFTLLNLLKPDEHNKEWSATELARIAGLSIGTTHRILQVMEEYGIVSQNKDNKKFRLGSALLEYGFLAQSLYTIRDIAKNYMEELAEATKETVYLSVPSEGQNAVIVDLVESKHYSLRFVEPIGSQYPFYISAGGRAMLAYMTESQQEALIRLFTWEPWTENTISDEANLRNELEVIRRQGYAISRGEVEPGTVGLAAPIFGPNGVEGSLALSGPDFRFTNDKIHVFIKELLDCSKRLSRALGGRFPL